MILTVLHKPDRNKYRPYFVFDENEKIIFYFRIRKNTVGELAIDLDFVGSLIAESNIVDILLSVDYKPITAMMAAFLQDGYLFDFSNVPHLLQPTGETP